MNKNDDFKIYNNCLISNLPPHKIPNTKNIQKLIEDNKALLARWTSEFDKKCNNENQYNWYYVIKDDCYDISALKSKDRNVINRAKKNFDCKFINPKEYEEEIYNIYLLMNETLPENSRSNINRNDFLKQNNGTYIGAFDKITNELSGYAILSFYDLEEKYINFSVLRYNPSKRSMNVNAAIIDFICNYYLNEKKAKYINDGARSIRHDTTFQDYLIRYFGFRKVYCRLNILYSSKLRIIIKLLYPFRRILKIFERNRLIHNVYSILIQEEILRKQDK